ncbi:hypothetical protein J6590_038682 [Homalodisca vitripennis]|nr:hypothetical protein J6590_038682 [Homalodisca vitripennis]
MNRCSQEIKAQVSNDVPGRFRTCIATRGAPRVSTIYDRLIWNLKRFIVRLWAYNPTDRSLFKPVFVIPRLRMRQVLYPKLPTDRHHIQMCNKEPNA